MGEEEAGLAFWLIERVDERSSALLCIF